jgi:hypothetical protein
MNSDYLGESGIPGISEWQQRCVEALVAGAPADPQLTFPRATWVSCVCRRPASFLSFLRELAGHQYECGYRGFAHSSVAVGPGGEPSWPPGPTNRKRGRGPEPVTVKLDGRVKADLGRGNRPWSALRAAPRLLIGTRLTRPTGFQEALAIRSDGGVSWGHLQ